MFRRVFQICLYISIVALIPVLFVRPALAQSAVSVGVGVGDTILYLSGRTSPQAFVSVYNGSGLIGTLFADAAGDFSQSFPAQSPGIHRLTFSAKDNAGRLSDAVTIETNLEQHATTSVFVFLPSTLEISDSSLSESQPLLVRGQTIPNGTLSAFINNQVAGSATTEPDGSWELTLPVDSLPNGFHNIFVRVHDANGVQSTPSREQSFTILRTPATPLPTLPITVPPRPVALLLSIPQIHFPANKQVVKQSRIIIAGLGPARTQIEVWEGERAIGTVWSDFNGNWSLPYSFTGAHHTIKVRSCLNGQCSPFSPNLSFQYQARSSAAPRLRARLKQHTLNSNYAEKNGKVTLHLQVIEGTPEFEVSVDWGDGKKSSHAGVSQDISLTHAYDKEGKYSGRLVIRNALGSQELIFSVNVSALDPARFQPLRPSHLAMLGILASLSLVLFRFLTGSRLTSSLKVPRRPKS